jgi:ubiquinone/menaquinone biosynthesis C-methylase UbiE
MDTRTRYTRETLSPAEVYDQQFVPALFQHWSSVMIKAANIKPRQHVLDVACGTGALTCKAAEQVGNAGRIVGLDNNNEMLEVARTKEQRIEWHHGPAEALPFEDKSFDTVVSQFGFMFFEDQRAALIEMMRVLRPGGQLAVAVCDAIDHSPGYAVLAELLHRLFGNDVAQAFRAPFTSGDRQRLQALCEAAGITDAKVIRHDGPVRFASIQSLVATERACAWTLGGLLDDMQFERLAIEAEEAFQPFITQLGEVEFNMPTLIITATKP